VILNGSRLGCRPNYGVGVCRQSGFSGGQAVGRWVPVGVLVAVKVSVGVMKGFVVGVKVWVAVGENVQVGNGVLEGVNVLVGEGVTGVLLAVGVGSGWSTSRL